MKKIMNARKGGFTLVELLIVIIIIAILAGMMLLTTGTATDGAEASKVINNLRSLKSAALLHYIDNDLVWIGTADDVVKELSPYMDRSIDDTKYSPFIASASDGIRFLIGFRETSPIFVQKPGIKDKLSKMSKGSGLFNADGTTEYAGTGDVMMFVR